MIGLVRVLVGLGVLTMGRQLFWLFVGGVGFMLGMNLATQIVGGESSTAVLIIALIIGFIGALFALFLQRIAVAIAGFLGGSIIAISLVDVFNPDGASILVPFLIGGILGMILVTLLFDWALIVISSFTGATFIVQSFDSSPGMTKILVIILLIVGVAIQAAQMQRQASGES